MRRIGVPRGRSRPRDAHGASCGNEHLVGIGQWERHVDRCDIGVGRRPTGLVDRVDDTTTSREGVHTGRHHGPDDVHRDVERRHRARAEGNGRRRNETLTNGHRRRRTCERQRIFEGWCRRPQQPPRADAHNEDRACGGERAGRAVPGNCGLHTFTEIVERLHDPVCATGPKRWQTASGSTADDVQNKRAVSCLRYFAVRGSSGPIVSRMSRNFCRAASSDFTESSSAVS